MKSDAPKSKAAEPTSAANTATVQSSASGAIPNLWLQASLGGNLAISQVDDPSEREADYAAERIIKHHGYNVAAELSTAPSRLIQPERNTDTAEPPAVHDSTAFSAPETGGSKLASTDQQFFEAHFGRSLNQVRIHTNPSANRAAQAISAQAFTLNNHIAFAPGRYKPGSSSGRQLLAHELAHVVQQQGRSRQVVQRLPDGPVTDAWVERRGREMAEAAAHRRATRSTWESSHSSRYHSDLSAEGGSLAEETERSSTALVGLRARGLSRLSRTAIDIPMVSDTEVNQDMPESMDATYGAARLAVDSLLLGLSSDEPLAPAIIDSATGPINSFYYTAVDFAETVEAADRQHAERDQARYDAELASYEMNIGTMRDFDMDPVDRRATAMTAMMTNPAPAYQAAATHSPELATLGEHARNATTDEEWWAVTTNFERAERLIDQTIMLALRDREYLGGNEIREGMDYYTNLRTNQERLQQEHPMAQRIQAIFYPQDQLVQAEGATYRIAHGIPWQLYLYHTASEAPDHVGRASDTWQLRDFTTGRSLPAFPSAEMDSAAVAGGAVVDPPTQMFSNFTRIVQFPDGIFYWNMPSGDTWSLPTSDDWTLSQWLQAIGIGIAAIALIAGTAGAATPVVVGLGIASAGLGIASTITERSERQELGTWTSDDEERAMVSIGADVISGLSMGLGSIVGAAGRAGRVATFAAANARAFGVMRRGAQILAITDLGGSMTQITYASSSLITAFQAVQSQPGLSDEERQRALGRLALTAMMVGTMGMLSIRGAAHDIRSAGQVRVATDEDGVLRLAREGADIDVSARAVPDESIDINTGVRAETGALPLRDLDAELRAAGITDAAEMAGPVHVDSTLGEGDVRIDLTRTENGLVDSVQFRIPPGFDPTSAMGADLLRVHNEVVRAFTGVTGRFRLAISSFQAALRGVDPPPLHLQMELWKHRRLASLRMERASALDITREQLQELEFDLINIQRRIDDIKDVIGNPARWGEYSADSVGTFGRMPGTEHLPPLAAGHQWWIAPDGVIHMVPRAGHTGAAFDIEYGPTGAPTGRLTNEHALINSGVLTARLVNPANGHVNAALARTLRGMGYDVSRSGVISLAAASGAGSMARGNFVLPLTIDANGLIRMTGVEFRGTFTSYADADLATAGTGGISSIEINPSRVAGFGYEVTIDGRLLPRLDRSGPVRPGSAPSYNNSFPYRPGEMGLGDNYQILHLWGPGFGDEAAAGLMLGPTALNQFWQNQRMEDLLRSLRDEGLRVGGEVRLTATARAWDMSSLPSDVQARMRSAAPADLDPLQAPFVREVTYRFELVGNNQSTGTGATITLTAGAPPSGAVNMSDFDVRGLSGFMSL